MNTSGAETILACTVPFFLLGLIFFLWGMRGRHQFQRGKTWPTTTAQITSIEAVREVHFNGRTTNTVYRPKVTYAYQVDGKSYKGTKFYFGTQRVYRSQGDAEQETAPYPLGSAVDIHYNPQKPSEAVIEPRLSKVSERLMVVGLVIGVGMVLAALLALIYFLSLSGTYSSI